MVTARVLITAWLLLSSSTCFALPSSSEMYRSKSLERVEESQKLLTGPSSSAHPSGPSTVHRGSRLDFLGWKSFSKLTSASKRTRKAKEKLDASVEDSGIQPNERITIKSKALARTHAEKEAKYGPKYHKDRRLIHTVADQKRLTIDRAQELLQAGHTLPRDLATRGKGKAVQQAEETPELHQAYTEEVRKLSGMQRKTKKGLEKSTRRVRGLLRSWIPAGKSEGAVQIAHNNHLGLRKANQLTSSDHPHQVYHTLRAGNGMVLNAEEHKQAAMKSFQTMTADIDTLKSLHPPHIKPSKAWKSTFKLALGSGKGKTSSSSA